MYILKPLTIDDLMILNIIYLELEKIIIKSATYINTDITMAMWCTDITGW